MQQRSAERIEAQRIYEEANGDIAIKDIAIRLQKSESVIRRWKSLDRWKPERRKRKSDVKPAKRIRIGTAKVKGDGLTPQEQDFCNHYAMTRNATSSYVVAFGVKYQSAQSHSSSLLATPRIQEEIKRIDDKTKRELKMPKENIVLMHMRIAFANILEFLDFGTEEATARADDGSAILDENGEPLTYQKSYVRPKQSDEVDGQLISEVRMDKGDFVIKLVDKQKSLDFLAKFFELYPMDAHKKKYDTAMLKLAQQQAEQKNMQNQDALEKLDKLLEGITDAAQAE